MLTCLPQKRKQRKGAEQWEPHSRRSVQTKRTFHFAIIPRVYLWRQANGKSWASRRAVIIDKIKNQTMKDIIESESKLARTSQEWINSINCRQTVHQAVITFGRLQFNSVLITVQKRLQSSATQKNHGDQWSLNISIVKNLYSRCLIRNRVQLMMRNEKMVKVYLL